MTISYAQAHDPEEAALEVLDSAHVLALEPLENEEAEAYEERLNTLLEPHRVRSKTSPRRTWNSNGRSSIDCSTRCRKSSRCWSRRHRSRSTTKVCRRSMTSSTRASRRHPRFRAWTCSRWRAARSTVGPPASDVPVLRTVGLTKTYGKLVALDQLNLEVQGGRVYGFLGPNGAGKTTTIDLLLKLIAPTAGHVEMLGLDMRTDGAEALRRSGAVPEGQAYFPLLSARDNLKVWGAISGETSEKRRDEVLDLVGLLPRAKDKVRTYSQGMKQRLGLAAALLHDPELLILDEPTNGLDPAGIREFRQLFRDLAARGKTVFVSSHLLNEVEVMCDEVGDPAAGQADHAGRRPAAPPRRRCARAGGDGRRPRRAGAAGARLAGRCPARR